MNLVFDLNKAFDKSKLVQVQVTVQGKNGTFQRMQWKNPADVKSTDKVIGNQAVLDAYLKKKDALKNSQNVAAGKFDMSKWTALKNANDKAGAFKYARDCGLVWSESNNAGINWMRLCMAVNKLSGAKITVKTTKPSGIKVEAVKLKVDGIAGFDSMNKKDKIKNLLVNGNSKDDLMSYFKGIGVSWPTTDKNGNPLPEGITWMRASMAIQSWLDGKTAADLGATVTVSTEDKSTTQSKPIEEPKQKPIDPNIEITADMTERKKNLANLINNITDEEELELIKSSHMVAEDDKARDYIKNTFFKAYKDWKDGNSARNNYRSQGSAEDTAKANADLFGGIFNGIAKKILKRGIYNISNGSPTSINIETLGYPRQMMTALNKTRYYNNLETEGFWQSGYSNHAEIMDSSRLFREVDKFSLFSKDKPPTEITNNNGSYDYNNPDRNDLSKHGFNIVLDKIARDIPSTKSEVDRIKKCYEEIMKLCVNTEVFDMIANVSNNYNNCEYEVMKEYTKRGKKTLDCQRIYINMFKDLANKYKLSTEDLAETIENSRYSSDGFFNIIKDGKTLTDTNTGSFIRIDCKDYDLDFRNKYGFSAWEHMRPGNYDDKAITLVFSIQDKISYEDLLSDPEKAKELKDIYEDETKLLNKYDWGYGTFSNGIRNLNSSIRNSKVHEVINEKMYCEIKKKLLEMYGQKVVTISKNPNSSANPIVTDIDTSNWSAKDWDLLASKGQLSDGTECCLTTSEDNDELDTVFANIQYIASNRYFLESIHSKVASGSTSSKANSQGTNYDANFSFIDSNSISGFDGYNYGQWCSTKKYTGDEVNAKIKEQLDNAPVITTKQRKQLKDFTEANGIVFGTYTDTDLNNKIVKANSYNLKNQPTFNGFKGTPIHDIITAQLQNLALYCPQMRNSRTNTDKKLFEHVANKLGNKPYASSTEKKNDFSVSNDNNAKLKALREEAFAVANCSLATADDNKRNSVETEVKHNWDISTYHEDKKYHSKGSRIYTNIKAEFNGVYIINNSGNQERFDKIVKDTGEKPVKLYHGTNRSGACGITGVDNKFSWTIAGAKTAGRMLGDGVYLADLVGKSAGYFGTWGSGYGKEGCLLICDVLKGREYVSTDHYDAKQHNKPRDVDTVSMQAGTNLGGYRALRADEWCINKADRVSPRIIVDMKAVNR